MTLAAFTLLLFSIAILIFWSGLFSGLETALFSLKSHQLRRLEEKHPSLQQFIQVLRETPRQVLNVLLLADAVVNIPLVVLCLLLIWEAPLAGRIPAWVAATVIFAIVVLLCDLVPKLLALSAPYRLSALGVFTLKATMPLLDRVGRVLERASTAIVERLTPQHLRMRKRISDEEIGTLVEIGEDQGTLHEAEGEMIQEIIKLGDKPAKDCMTPRVDTFALPDDLTNEEAVVQLRER